jgi:presenilin-like A22 family membrane protease
MKVKNFSINILGQGVFYFAITFMLIAVSTENILARATLYVPSEPVSLWYFLISFGIITLAMVFLLRKVKTRLPFEVFFTLAIFAGIWFLADIWLLPSWAIIAAVVVTFLKFIYPRIWWQNILMITGIAGVVVSLGTNISWVTAIILIVFLSFYDIAAVYFTRHMVTMFKDLLQKGVVFALILPVNLRSLRLPLKKVKPGEDFMLLGTGDLALPGILVASLVSESIGQASFAALGAIIGFIIMNVIFSSQEKRKPMPALPPIAAGASLGFLVSLALGL